MLAVVVVVGGAIFVVVLVLAAFVFVAMTEVMSFENLVVLKRVAVVLQVVVGRIYSNQQRQSNSTPPTPNPLKILFHGEKKIVLLSSLPPLLSSPNISPLFLPLPPLPSPQSILSKILILKILTFWMGSEAVLAVLVVLHPLPHPPLPPLQNELLTLTPNHYSQTLIVGGGVDDGAPAQSEVQGFWKDWSVFGRTGREGERGGWG